jgi:arginyl-tRNA synthetase
MIRDQLKELISTAIISAQESGALPAVETPAFDVLHPKQADHGDYSSNAALVLAASLRKALGTNANPRQLAQTIIDHLPANPIVAGVELAGPGFINVRLSDAWLQQQVNAVIAAGDDFGNSQRGAGQHWQVEYVSANPTGPIHYGGARNAVLGEALANVLQAAGYDVQREFYVNDGGLQFSLFIETLYARYMHLFDRDVPLPENGYVGEYVVGYAERVRDQVGDRFVDVPREVALAELRPIGRAIVLESLKSELARINVTFDNWFSEQSLYDSGAVQQALDYMRDRGQLKEMDGALWFKASDYPGNEKDEVVVRSNGIPTYLASDIAYHYDKFIRRGFDHVVDVWAVDHQGHVPRMNAVMAALGLDPQRLTLLLYDLVKLVRDGKEVKLSKRLGNLVTISDVVDEVGSDPIHFNLLSRGPESVVEFDLDLAVAQNNENPVFYVQYSHARICSILEKARAEGFDTEGYAADAADLSLLTHPSELALIRKVLELEEQIDLAVDRLSPHNLTQYAIDLARTFNAFYRDCRVVDAENRELSRARLQLGRAARTALAKVLALIGVSAPQVM